MCFTCRGLTKVRKEGKKKGRGHSELTEEQRGRKGSRRCGVKEGQIIWWIIWQIMMVLYACYGHASVHSYARDIWWIQHIYFSESSKCADSKNSDSLLTSQGSSFTKILSLKACRSVMKISHIDFFNQSVPLLSLYAQRNWTSSSLGVWMTKIRNMVINFKTSDVINKRLS